MKVELKELHDHTENKRTKINVEKQKWVGLPNTLSSGRVYIYNPSSQKNSFSLYFTKNAAEMTFLNMESVSFRASNTSNFFLFCTLWLPYTPYPALLNSIVHASTSKAARSLPSFQIGESLWMFTDNSSSNTVWDCKLTFLSFSRESNVYSSQYWQLF